MSEHFQDRFCVHFGIAPEQYHQEVFRRVAYPQARWLRRILPGSRPEFFAPDDEFVAGMGRICRRSEFASEAEEFAHYPANRTFLRRVLRLRISIGRMQALANLVFNETLLTDQANLSRPPFVPGAKF